MYRDAQTTTLLGDDRERERLEKSRQIVLIVLRILASIVVRASLNSLYIPLSVLPVVEISAPLE